jgi:hypothetical protein
MAMMGEIHTALLNNDVAVSPSAARDILGFIEGERVRHSSRPVARTISPELLTGVDCGVRSDRTGGVSRFVGTVTTRAVLTGGHVLQGSAFVEIAKTPTGRRLPWAHYLGRPGMIQPLGTVDQARLLDAQTWRRSGSSVVTRSNNSDARPLEARALDLGASCDSVLDAALGHHSLNRRAPFRRPRAHLRWIVDDDTDSGILVRLDDRDGSVDLVRLPARAAAPAAYARLGEELALRDWLLTTVLRFTEQARIGAGDRRATLSRLAPALDHLAHLWSVAPRLTPPLDEMIRAIDAHIGLTDHWLRAIERVRDQFALASGERSTPAAG